MAFPEGPLGRMLLVLRAEVGEVMGVLVGVAGVGLGLGLREKLIAARPDVVDVDVDVDVVDDGRADDDDGNGVVYTSLTPLPSVVVGVLVLLPVVVEEVLIEALQVGVPGGSLVESVVYIFPAGGGSLESGGGGCEAGGGSCEAGGGGCEAGGGGYDSVGVAGSPS